MVLGLCGLEACAHGPLGPPYPTVAAPVLNWAAVTTGAGPITYNVYAVPGVGPIPTAPSGPCGVAKVAEGPPLNPEPITATTFTASVADGVWTFAVEAVAANGCRSGLSSPVTVTVLNQGGSPTNVSVGR